MTPKFAQAVDPIFEHVLQLLDRIDRNDLIAPDEEKHIIKRMLDRSEAALGASQEWQWAKYGLVCWIDEVLLAAPWEGRHWWNENSLESSVYSQRLRATDFFVMARDASTSPQREALEVYYLAVILGFRGLYDKQETAFEETQRLELPAELSDWVKQTAQAILPRPKPPLAPTRNFGRGAPPLSGQSMLIGAAAVVAIVSAVTLMSAWVLYAM